MTSRAEAALEVLDASIAPITAIQQAHAEHSSQPHGPGMIRNFHAEHGGSAIYDLGLLIGIIGAGATIISTAVEILINIDNNNSGAAILGSLGVTAMGAFVASRD